MAKRTYETEPVRLCVRCWDASDDPAGSTVIDAPKGCRSWSRKKWKEFLSDELYGVDLANIMKGYDKSQPAVIVDIAEITVADIPDHGEIRYLKLAEIILN